MLLNITVCVFEMDGVDGSGQDGQPFSTLRGVARCKMYCPCRLNFGNGAFSVSMYTVHSMRVHTHTHTHIDTIRVVVCRHAWGGAYATEMLTYEHRQARKLRHCGVTPLRCKHMTTGMYGSCTTVELHRYGADIRLHACMEAAPLWRYAAVVQT